VRNFIATLLAAALAFPSRGSAATPAVTVRPGDLVAGADGNLWFPEMGTGLVARMTPAGYVTEFAVPGAAALGQAIAGGPDGRVWVVGFGVDSKVHVWAVGVSGAAADVATLGDRPPVLGFLPSGMTAGPDRNVWIANLAEIDRVSPSGQLARFAIGEDAIATSIAAGADGNLWFVATLGAFGSRGQGVWRVTTGGAMARVLDESRTGISSPASIIAGADGNLWFADNGYSEVVKITTSPVGRTDLPFTGASRLAAGPDGNLWITVPARRAIARLSPDGSSTEFVLPTPLSLPLSITAGPDGNLWFSEPDNGVVGRITPQGSVREFAIGVLPRAPLPRTARSPRLVSNR
jgi:virginiamycin B lyase